MIYGQPGSGKTTFLLEFAHYLTRFGDVLYVSGEEYNSSPLTEKVNALPSIPSNLHFSKRIKGVQLSNYRFIILDSVTDLGIDLDTYKKLREDNPDTCFILILQTTKDGNFRGGKEWEHEVEIAAEIQDGVINIYKNRYGTKGQLNFFTNKQNTYNLN
jgi:predicted ATP-dependent serine protease